MLKIMSFFLIHLETKVEVRCVDHNYKKIKIKRRISFDLRKPKINVKKKDLFVTLPTSLPY